MRNYKKTTEMRGSRVLNASFKNLYAGLRSSRVWRSVKG